MEPPIAGALGAAHLTSCHASCHIVRNRSFRALEADVAVLTSFAEQLYVDAQQKVGMFRFCKSYSVRIAKSGVEKMEKTHGLASKKKKEKRNAINQSTR